MHEITRNEGSLVTVRATGKLTQEDYDQLIPVWERVIEEEGPMRMLLVMADFHGWEPGAAWDDFRFAAGHSSKVNRVAMVGEKKWQEWLAKLGSVFLPERVRYFDLAELPDAEHWVRAELGDRSRLWLRSFLVAPTFIPRFLSSSSLRSFLELAGRPTPSSGRPTQPTSAYRCNS